MLSEQASVCKICSTTGTGNRLVVDHCHSSGKVRGLLCDNCNAGLGQFQDSPDRLIEALRYIRRNQ